MYTLGVDIGSTACKAVALKDGKEVVGSCTIPAGTGTSGPSRVYEGVYKDSGLSSDEISRIVVTGYGRMTFDKADEQISELSCHAKGAHFLVPEAKTIIDIGGQDAKAMKLNKSGMLSQFVMNDKCAAGTGRFLDIMAKVLEVDVAELEEISSKSKERITISNICTVFAESEVISQLAAGKSREDIASGIHLSIANRVAGLVRRLGIEREVVMTGGVAQNGGVVNSISEVLEVPVTAAPIPQLIGAFGAALFAYERTKKL